MKRYVVLMGAPGAGKGTQAATLAQKLGLLHLATGDLFREAVGKGTELGRQAKAYMDRGTLVPDELTIALVEERLAKTDAANGAVLDGFPRTLEQARALDQSLARRGETVEKAVNIEVSEEAVVARLAGRCLCRQCQASYHVLHNPPKQAGKCDVCGGELYQRTDDKPETVRARLEVYRDMTAPLIEYYRQAGKLAAVNGEQDIENVQKVILAALGDAKESPEATA